MSDYVKQLEEANKNLEQQLIKAKRKLSESLFEKFTIESTKMSYGNHRITGKPIYNYTYKVKIGSRHIYIYY